MHIDTAKPRHPAKLTSLTAEQAALLPVIRDRWLAHGLSTQPADRPAAEAGVAAAYRAAGLEPPGIVVWVDSPLAGCYAAALLAGWKLVGDQVGDQVRAQVWAQVRAQVRAQVGDQVRAQVWAQVGDQVWAQVGAQVRAQVWDQVGDQVNRATYGQHDANWLAYCDTFAQLGIQAARRVNGLAQVARASGWWWPFRGAVVLTERPTVLHRDNQLRLHCEDGPAVAYPDGFAVHAWHGTRVPADLIDGHGWDTERILGERNTEIRRCAMEKAGPGKVIGLLTKVAVEDDPGNPGQRITLYDLPPQLAGTYDSDARLLHCVNGTVERDGTRREFLLPVPAHHETPAAAAADLYGWPVAAYRQLARRT